MSAYPIENNSLRIVKIQRVVKESPSVKTFSFADKLCAKGKPGQFLMVWLPRFDEIPMSISSTSPKDSASITVAEVGEATRLLHQKGKGDVIGIRGPFGNSFQLVKGKALIVGGGTGIAPLFFLASRLLESKAHVTFLLGAKTRNELLFLPRIEERLSGTSNVAIAATEDGSYGYEGVVTELAEKTLSEDKFDMIYTCGKEAMLSKVFILAEKNKTPMQASLERLMRCAIGLCGSCTIGKYRTCTDGPIFASKQLREVKDEFGRCRRDLDGRRIPA
ncbi:MAG: dihydroorotate dehydrogenase electron transfer subunit [Candidatus Bathyarchaeia archaeon]